jgi:Cu/Zn superoxide dismutase
MTTNLTVRRMPALLAAAALALALVATLLAGGPVQAATGEELLAEMIDAEGEDVGFVAFTEVRGGVLVEAVVDGLTPGFHGFHVHAGTTCTDEGGAPDFARAEGHLGHDPDGDTPHGSHTGDMPVLFATTDGDAHTRFVTDSFTLSAIEGRAVIIHAGPDNFAHIPDRYSSTAEGAPATGPDAETLAAGDAGARVACGVVGPGTGSVPAPVEGDRVTARLLGVPAGTVSVTALADGTVRVQAHVEGLTPGFHGFHIHAGDRCTDDDGRPDFLLAGGHLGHDADHPEDTPHGSHPGDLQILRADAGGIARASFVTDAFSVSEVEGRAVIVHAEPDNYGNIPDRYQSSDEAAPEQGPDAATLATGDAGARVACGVLETTEPMSRLAGASRIETAAAASEEAFPIRASAVVLARADRFPDALAGGPLAAAVDGPVLLTYPDALHPATEAELRRIMPDAGQRVYVLGGPAAISEGVVDHLRDLGYEVQRVAGHTRVQTALAVAGELGDPGALLITTGFRFPDALAAGAAAAHIGGAVLLTVGEERHPDVDAYLAEHPDAEVFAVGGPAARPYDDAESVSGATREDTAVAVAERFFATPLVAGVARRGDTGDDTDPSFADALAGGAHAGRLGGPLLLTAGDSAHPATVGYLCRHARTVDVGYVYGGQAAFSEQTAQLLGVATRGCVEPAD